MRPSTTPPDHPSAPATTARPPIAPLPPEVVERIAAGEVIERPASALRELIENALDAGARGIRIELREGGTRLIRVADDGGGIPPEELALACQPHATSKVRTLTDLEAITTLGFRGEALASIAAVAALEVVSACGQDGVAETISMEGGALGPRGRQPRSRGTTVTVRDLFAALPARRALLRGPTTEAARCLRVARAYALAHPAVRFVVVCDGLLALQSPGTTLAETVEALYGADVARALLPLGPLAREGRQVAGYVAARTFSFPVREHVYVLLNGRPVANRPLLAGAEAGYRPLLRKGRHPLLIARLEVPPESLDANIHPTKASVLLRDEQALGASLREAIHAALGTAPLSLPGSTAPNRGQGFARPLALRLPAPRQRRGLRLAERRSAYVGADEDDDPLPSGPLPPLEPLAQLDGALILARSPGGHLFLVDQHRAHERMIYERLLRQREPLERLGEDANEMPGSGTGQLLLEPLVVELTAEQAKMLLPRLELLRALGLECQPFGGAVFLVRAVPQVAGARQSMAAEAESLVRDAAGDAPDWLDALCRSLACRAAVRRGQALGVEEQRALLADLAPVATPALCPHGSPLLLRYTRGALARAFEW